MRDDHDHAEQLRRSRRARRPSGALPPARYHFRGTTGGRPVWPEHERRIAEHAARVAAELARYDDQRSLDGQPAPKPPRVQAPVRVWTAAELAAVAALLAANPRGPWWTAAGQLGHQLGRSRCSVLSAIRRLRRQQQESPPCPS